VDVSYGLTVVGGVFPNDPTRSAGFVSTSGSGFAPSVSLVSGNAVVNASTVGVNTYAPTTESYALDVNGPVHIHHGEVHHTYTTSFSVLGTSYNGSTFVSVGKPVLVGSQYVHYALVSHDYMQTWTPSPIDLGNNDSNPFDAVYAMPGTPFVFVGGDQDYLFYSNDSGSTWNTIQTYDSNLTFQSLYSVQVSSSVVRLFGTYQQTASVSVPSSTYIDISLSSLQAGGTIHIPFSSYHDFYDLTVVNNLRVSGNGSFVYTLGRSSSSSSVSLFQRYDLSMNPLSTLSISHPLNTLQVFPTRGIVLLGDNQYYYSTSFAPVSFSSGILSLSSVSLSSCSWYDPLHAVLVGQNLTNGSGVFYSSADGLASFSAIPDSILNQQGNASQLLRYGLTDVWMTGLGTFLMGGSYGSSLHQYFSLFLPDVFAPLENSVLSVAGRVDICGNVYLTNLTGVDASFANVFVGSLQGYDISASVVSVDTLDVSSVVAGFIDV